MAETLAQENRKYFRRLALGAKPDQDLNEIGTRKLNPRESLLAWRRMKSDDKVVCGTPTPGKQSKRIARWKYEAVRKAILAALPRRGEGVRFQDLSDLVAQRLPAELRARLGSVNWYTATVKLALETRGEITRVPGSTPQRLLRAIS